MFAGAVVGLFIDDGPVYYAATFVAVAASGVVLAFAIGSVAVAYEGVPRATALGAVYGAYGAGTALAPVASTIIIVRVPSEVDRPARRLPASRPGRPICSPRSPRWWRLWAARRWLPRIPGTLPAPTPLIVGVAVWSMGLLAIVVGVLGLAGRGSQAHAAGAHRHRCAGPGVVAVPRAGGPASSSASSGWTGAASARPSSSAWRWASRRPSHSCSCRPSSSTRCATAISSPRSPSPLRHRAARRRADLRRPPGALRAARDDGRGPWAWGCPTSPWPPS